MVFAESQISRVRQKHGPSRQRLIQGSKIMKNEMEYKLSLTNYGIKYSQYKKSIC